MCCDKDSGDDVYQAGQDGEPGRLEVEMPAASGKCTHNGAFGQAEQDGRAYREAEHGGRADIPGFAPIEVGMHKNDGETAEGKSEEAEREDPVRDADQRGPRCGLLGRGLASDFDEVCSGH